VVVYCEDPGRTKKDKTLMEKISIINTLGKDEQQAIFKVIDLAASNKKLKDNLQSLIAQ
jgi:hypothetical protein